ncbi:MAG: hypothetical protein WCR67_04660 [Bacilli bacterium]
MENIKKRFSRFTVNDWVIAISLTVVMIVGVVFSICFSVKLSQGYTLFGNSDAFAGNVVESVGPTSADIMVTTLFWILSVILLAYDVFFFFFRKIEKKTVVHKEIINGRTIVIEEKNTEDENK